ncbi:MAG: hypothetical protein A2214_01415 [Candidatus Harrisonbacteria bacterium RIFOXYA1_FULL_48_8]|uniref:Uncharacterized protein n=1 Tax=Candidatus Harrisonbacteria bacterium RIFOXYA1_FULL_48_8 TaxID=1798411 RepID=A0A1G1ZXQ2_9BACT|nr:MAG: hypothetical protein A2214_01415 [Candidatus Harrisonbacteria bacterium RIFOXYA1_FULL_48_8]
MLRRGLRRPETRGQMSKWPKLLAWTQETTAGVPAALEPKEAEIPTPAIPVEARNAAVATIIPPERPREGEIEVPLVLRDFALALEEPLGIFLTGVGVELDSRSPDHLLAIDAVLALLQDGD